MNHTPDLPQMFTPRTGFLKPSDIETHLKSSIAKAEHYNILRYEDVNEEWAAKIIDSLDKMRFNSSYRLSYSSVSLVLRLIVMPTPAHDCSAKWWRLCELDMVATGVLTPFEQAQFESNVGTTMKFTTGPYLGSVKQPDFFIRTDDEVLPSLVIEVGWSESYDDLLSDLNLLMIGGDGMIRTTIIIKLSKSTKRGVTTVNGFIELYTLNRRGIPVIKQEEVYLCTLPTNRAVQSLRLTRKEVFGPFLVNDPGRVLPVTDRVEMSIEHLRTACTRGLQRMNLTPSE
ncbi:hypothetical protein N7495_006910 [Penicillium taxi]|uniref:uncharacterized protein n=1 Tax=Penicillium taxi TaxID=168475 RepID=UPI0025454016|nr:uncharacterized protein N7495_006910 [Penicillium taxi]KAJ5895219.1 hypothetical protein N7495_006910 [Penicillium taxi]